MANLGVPIKLLHESLGHIITVELKTGEVSALSFYEKYELMIDVPREIDGRCVTVIKDDGVQLT
jgi:small nuclear ribonucleoprotein D3